MRHASWLAGLLLAVLTSASVQAATTTINYFYDSHNRLQTVIRDDGPTYSYTYDAAGNITRRDTSATWLSSLTVSASSTTIAPGQSVTLTATVAGSSPTGTVQFQINGVNLGAPVPLVNGVATLTTSQLTALGNAAITAIYSGDPSNAASGTPTSITVAVKNMHDGDLNGDGVVDLADVLLANKIISGQMTPTADQLQHGDVAPLVNGVPAPNGVFDLGDLVVIVRKALGDVNF